MVGYLEPITLTDDTVLSTNIVIAVFLAVILFTFKIPNNRYYHNS